MKTYNVLLRGINISGQKKIPMPELRKILQEAGLENVQTYIQSGNLVLRSSLQDPAEISDQIRQMIGHHFGYEVETFVLDRTALKYILDHHPFAPDHPEEGNRLFDCFLSEVPVQYHVKALANLEFDQEFFHIEDRYIYMYYPGGIGKAKTNNNFSNMN